LLSVVLLCSRYEGFQEVIGSPLEGENNCCKKEGVQEYGHYCHDRVFRWIPCTCKLLSTNGTSQCVTVYHGSRLNCKYTMLSQHKHEERHVKWGGEELPYASDRDLPVRISKKKKKPQPFSGPAQSPPPRSRLLEMFSMHYDRVLYIKEVLFANVCPVA
jgi:hypothetical protein